MLKCTCNPSAATGGRDKVCCAPFQTTLLVKSVRFEKRPKSFQENPPRDPANSGNSTLELRFETSWFFMDQSAYYPQLELDHDLA